MRPLQLEILRFVDEKGGSISECRIMFTLWANHSRDVIAGEIAGLVFARMLNRTVSGEGSGRRYHVALTAKGRAELVDEGEKL